MDCGYCLVQHRSTINENKNAVRALVNNKPQPIETVSAAEAFSKINKSADLGLEIELQGGKTRKQDCLTPISISKSTKAAMFMQRLSNADMES